MGEGHRNTPGLGGGHEGLLPPSLSLGLLISSPIPENEEGAPVTPSTLPMSWVWVGKGLTCAFMGLCLGITP